MEEFNTKILCPMCGYNYVHFGEPLYKCSGDKWGVAWRGRGNAIKIPMYCEDDHKWDLVIGHHKGETFIYCESKDITRFKTETTL